MAKNKSSFVCANCGHSQATFFGTCRNCGESGTAEEREFSSHARASHDVGTMPAAQFEDLTQVDESDAGSLRMNTGLPELDRILGGGLVPASYLILAGDPGAGKTTMASEIVLALSKEGKKVGYVSGEESRGQAKMRFNRLSEGKTPEGILISEETGIERIIEAVASEGFDLLVVDSIQTVYSESLPSAPGSLVQVKECGMKLMKAAKKHGSSILLIGQVTKGGDMAGPKNLEHMVDAVLQFEGDRREEHRILRAVKNRFGTIDEIGVFEMTATGLQGISDPSRLFVSEEEPRPGSAFTAVIEGTRPVLCEIQALVTPSNLPQPIRTARGLDPKRLQMLLAVLSRHGGLSMGSMDVYVNVSGGLKLDDPGADLAVCLAIASAEKEKLTRERYCAFGEVSLLGVVREASQAERRKREAERLGLKQFSPSPNETLRDLLSGALQA